MTDPQNNIPSPPGNVDPNIKSPENPLRSKTAVRLALLYDIVMLLVIVIDLSIISLDLLLMSKFMGQVADWLNLSQKLLFYVDNICLLYTSPSPRD